MRLQVVACSLSLGFVLTSSLPAQTADPVRDWLSAHAHALQTTDPTTRGAGDLAPLRSVVGDARVVGIGESVHYMREFLNLRLRMLRYFVEELGFTALTFESGLAEAERLNAYVLGEPGTRSVPPDSDFTGGLTYGAGDFEEIRAALRWLRDHNRSRPANRKVRFYGIDLPRQAGSFSPAIDSVWAYLERVDPAEAAASRKRIEPMARRFTARTWSRGVAQYDSLTSTERADLSRAVTDLALALASRRAAYVGRSSAEAYELAARQAVVVHQTEMFLRAGPRSVDNMRDFAMADNVRWVLDREGPTGRVIVWAHNAHVQTVPIQGAVAPQPVQNVGLYLERVLGPAQYVSVGFAYNVSTADSTLTPADSGSVDAALARVGKPLFLLDLTKPPATGPVADWLRAVHPMRFQVGYLNVAPGRAFDAIIYVDRITPATRVPGAGR